MNIWHLLNDLMVHLNVRVANRQNIVKGKKYFQEDIQSVVMAKAIMELQGKTVEQLLHLVK